MSDYARPGLAPNNSKFCLGCAKPLHVSARSCPECGAHQAIGGSGEKNRVVAVVLALLVGGIGVHKFYLDRPGAGILYLLFCWTFIPALVSFIEGILYAFMSDEAFHQKYG